MGAIRFPAVEILYIRRRKRLDEGGHAFFPSRIPHHGQPFDVAEVPCGKLGVFPQSAGGPALEVAQFNHQANLGAALHEPFQFGNEHFVIFFFKLALKNKGNDVPLR